LEALLEALIEFALSVGEDIEITVLAMSDFLKALEDKMDLGFDHKDDRIVSESGIGADEEVKIGEARDSDTEIGLAASLPEFIEFLIVESVDFHGFDEVVDAEACGINEDISGAVGAVLGLDAVGGDGFDGIGHKLNMGALEGGVIIIRDEDAFASEAVIGGEFFS
jgi:hypothetical protein